MALPNYAKMFPTAPRSTVPPGVSPSAWALQQSRANEAAAQESRYDWIRGNIAGGTPSFLVGLMGPNSGLPADIAAAADARYYSIYPKGPELSGAAGNLPYLEQRAYDAMIRNEQAQFGEPTHVTTGLPEGSGGNPRFGKTGTSQDPLYGTPQATGMTGGASPYPVAPTSPTPTPAATPAAPPPNWFKPESDPSGSIWDVFNESLKRATMPTNFRATWG